MSAKDGDPPRADFKVYFQRGPTVWQSSFYLTDTHKWGCRFTFRSYPEVSWADGKIALLLLDGHQLENVERAGLLDENWCHLPVVVFFWWRELVLCAPIWLKPIPPEHLGGPRLLPGISVAPLCHRRSLLSSLVCSCLILQTQLPFFSWLCPPHPVFVFFSLYC